MGIFYTEKEAEQYLETETRMIVMPDGSKQSISKTKLMWVHYDFIVHKEKLYTPERIVELTLIDCQEKQADFVETFEGLVFYISNRLRESLDSITVDDLKN